jgi:hypothetical protein
MPKSVGFRSQKRKFFRGRTVPLGGSTRRVIGTKVVRSCPSRTSHVAERHRGGCGDGTQRTRAGHLLASRPLKGVPNSFPAAKPNLAAAKLRPRCCAPRMAKAVGPARAGPERVYPFGYERRGCSLLGRAFRRHLQLLATKKNQEHPLVRVARVHYRYCPFSALRSRAQLSRK